MWISYVFINFVDSVSFMILVDFMILFLCHYYRNEQCSIKNHLHFFNQITNFKIEKRELFIQNIISFSMFSQNKSIFSIHNEYIHQIHLIKSKINDSEVLMNEQEKLNLNLLIQKEVNNFKIGNFK